MKDSVKNFMKPYIICHMMASLDGRIDCDMTEQLDDGNSYYEILESLNCEATIEGRVTLAMHYADEGLFKAKKPAVKAGKQVYKAKESAKYAVGVDTRGTLLWSDDVESKFERPLVMILSEDASAEYLDYLKGKGISYITIGEGSIDLKAAVEILNKDFGVKRLALVGGGNLNGSFLAEGLIDEISMIYGPGIDGRVGMAAAFDGIEEECKEPTQLKLQSVKQYGDAIALRYTVK